MVAAKSPICLKFEMDRKHSLVLKSLATGKGLPAISQISLNFSEDRALAETILKMERVICLLWCRVYQLLANGSGEESKYSGYLHRCCRCVGSISTWVTKFKVWC